MKVMLAVSAIAFLLLAVTPAIAQATATVDINPNTLNLKSKGKYVTVFISDLSEGSVADINPTSIQLVEAGLQAVRSEVEDGVLMVKFKRAPLIDYLIDYVKTLPEFPTASKFEATLTVTFTLNGGSSTFSETDTITVINKPTK